MSAPPQAPPPGSEDTTAMYSGYVDAERSSTIPDGVGFWPRAVARIIDMVVHWAVTIASALMLGVMAAVATSIAGGNIEALATKFQSSSPWAFVAGVLGFLAYHSICEGMHGSTLGKLLLGQVVVTDQVRPCGIRAACIRSLAYLVPDALVFGVPAYLEMQKTRLQKRHGDNWAGTFVARRSQVPISTLRSTGRFIGAFLLAVAVDAAIAMVYYALRLV